LVTILNLIWLLVSIAAVGALLVSERGRSYERLVAGELGRSALGELGWSAEWRKGKLVRRDRTARTRRWREYCCESFCDTAAWVYAGVERHEEFTLATRLRAARRKWFARNGLDAGISI